MARKDDGFNLDDMMEIFGDAPAAPARAITEAPLLVVAPASEELTDDEQALLRAYEQRKQEKRAGEERRVRQERAEFLEREERHIIEEFERDLAAASAGHAALQDIGAQENEAFCALLEETRAVMFTFLLPLIGAKATSNMLNKSLEKTRAKALVLKDANWRMDGELREDGSVDPERLLKNLSALAPETRVEDYLDGLHSLVDLRVRAVEAGLGEGTCSDLKARLKAACSILAQASLPAPWVALFQRRVLA
jgi:translation initiation factor 2 beta subunit (eIF-2beta)/eIF-5